LFLQITANSAVEESKIGKNQNAIVQQKYGEDESSKAEKNEDTKIQQRNSKKRYKNRQHKLQAVCSPENRLISK